MGWWGALETACSHLCDEQSGTEDGCLLYDLCYCSDGGIHLFVQKACHLSASPTVKCTSAFVKLLIGLLLLVCITYETQLSIIYQILALQGGSAVPCSL